MLDHLSMICFSNWLCASHFYGFVECLLADGHLLELFTIKALR